MKPCILRCYLLTNILFLLSNHSIAYSDWAEETLQTMTIDEKIGQLFMVAGYIEPGFYHQETGKAYHAEEIEGYIKEFYVGGIGYVGPSESIKQVCLTNHYQEISKFPLIIAQDLEWGLSMRHKDCMSFPKNITLGAVKNNHLIYEIGKEIGRQAKLIGVHMNLSPVLDINTEPENPVINIRSFGSSPKEVAEKGIAMIQGMQDEGIIASAKHFPGLGDITIDPHLALPYSSHERKRLNEIEFYPFAQAIQAGVLSIQTEHLMVLCLEPDPSTPASLSYNTVTGILKNELGFKGLVLSGALRMKALTNYFSDEEIILKAFLAGNDMLLMPHDFPKAFSILKNALNEGKISETQIDERVLKILQIKEKLSLHEKRIVGIPKNSQFHTPSAKKLKEQLYQEAITFVSKDRHPFSLSSRIAYVQLGEAQSIEFLDTLKENLNCDNFYFPHFERDTSEEQKLIENIGNYELIILAVYPADPRRIASIRLLNEKEQKTELKHFRVHGIPEHFITLLKLLHAHEDKTLVTFFGNPYGLPFFEGYSSLIMAYEPDPIAQQVAAKLCINRLFDPD